MYISASVAISASSRSSPDASRSLQPVDPGALDVLEHQHAPPHQVGHDLGHHHLRLGGEVPLQRRRVAGLLPEVELVGDPLGELAHDRGDRPDLMAGKQQVEEEEDPEGDVEVAAHHLLDAGPQHLDHDLAPAVRRAMHLAQRGRGERLGVEPLEDPAGVLAQLRRGSPAPRRPAAAAAPGRSACRWRRDRARAGCRRARRRPGPA